MAHSFCAGYVGAGRPLQIRSEPHRAKMALDYTWGSVTAAIVWLAASALFSWYVASFGSYNKTYGSLGAVVGFMTWIWISMIVVLLGAKLNAEMEHQTVYESTIGQPRPIGRRGARMADTVGAAQA